jgi:hypothetical protein
MQAGSSTLRAVTDTPTVIHVAVSQLAAIRSDSIQLAAIQLAAIQLAAIRLAAIQLAAIRLAAIRLAAMLRGIDAGRIPVSAWGPMIGLEALNCC